MSALTADRTRNMLPIALTGLVMIASGLVRAEIWLAFVGAIVSVCAFLLMRQSAGRIALPFAHLEALPAPASPSLAEPAESKSGPLARGPAFRLRPIVPLPDGIEIHSWLGGLPRLPDDASWPELGGRPALFLAQLSCAHLPARLWGGSGPRDGWLVIFAEQGAPGCCRVLHTKTLGEERQPPAPLRYPHRTAMRADILEIVTGQPTGIPRCPVEFCPAGDAPDAPQIARPAAHADLSDPAFQPFDWPSARILLEVVTSDLAWQRDVIARFSEDGADEAAPDPATEAFLAQTGETLAHLDDLRAELAAAESHDLPFSDALLALLLRGLDSLTVDAPVSGAGEEARRLPLSQHDQILRDYAHWFERYARQRYSEDPASLPQPHRAAFEERWSALAEAESGWMGARAPSRFRSASGSGRLTLLRLPGSGLMGWHFGKSGELGLFLSRAALEVGDFSRCKGELAS